MTTSDSESATDRGWGIPTQSRKWHYFVGSMSLCRKWGFFGGKVVDEHHDSPDNCTECKRLYKRDLAPAERTHPERAEGRGR